MKYISIALALLFISVGVTSCKEDDEGCTSTATISHFDQDKLDQLAKDIEYIDDYLSQNGITAIEHETGLRYVIHTQGTGVKPGLCSAVRVKYSGHLLNRTSIFDSSDDMSFNLSNLILGWKIGFTQLESGTSATLYIPSGLGYGVDGAGSSIPGNANLVFDVELIDVY